MSGYSSGGTDFDAILEPRQGSDPVLADVDYADGGVDLSDIYAPASEGDPGPNVGYSQGGSDIGPLFCAVGTRVDPVDAPTMQSDDIELYADGGPVTANAAVEWNSAAAGGSGWAHGQIGNAAGTSPFEWLVLGSASDYEIMFTHTTGQAVSGSALDTWLSLGSVQLLSISATASGGSSEVNNASGSYQIRRVSNGAVVGSNSWLISAEVSFVG